MSKKKTTELNSVGPANQVDTARRGFIKKAGYTAPALIALGLLGSAQNAHAQFGPPPSLDQAPASNKPPNKPSRG